MQPLKSLHDTIHMFGFFDDADTTLDGVHLWRQGDLARDNGITRWKRAPVGTGANADLLELNLRAKGLKLYSSYGNAAAGGNGSIMTSNVLRHIHADDYVIVLDNRFETARQLETGAIDLIHPYDSTALAAYRGDEIRAANFNDALQVGWDVLRPLVFG